MNWLKKKVIKWVREDWENKRTEANYIGSPVRDYNSSPEIETNKWMNIRVQQVAGGTIVSFENHSRFDSQKNGTRVYIINEGEVLGDALSKLIAQETLRS